MGRSLSEVVEAASIRCDATSSALMAGGSLESSSGAVTWLQNAVAPSGTVQALLAAFPNAPAALWLGTTTQLQQNALLTLGSLLPAQFVTLDPASNTLSASGSLVLVGAH